MNCNIAIVMISDISNKTAMKNSQHKKCHISISHAVHGSIISTLHILIDRSSLQLYEEADSIIPKRRKTNIQKCWIIFGKYDTATK